MSSGISIMAYLTSKNYFLLKKAQFTFGVKHIYGPQMAPSLCRTRCPSIVCSIVDLDGIDKIADRK